MRSIVLCPHVEALLQKFVITICTVIAHARYSAESVPLSRELDLKRRVTTYPTLYPYLLLTHLLLTTSAALPPKFTRTTSRYAAPQSYLYGRTIARPTSEVVKLLVKIPPKLSANPVVHLVPLCIVSLSNGVSDA